MAAALVMTVAVRASPSAIASDSSESAAPRFGHAGDEDDLVVHREAEDDAEHEHGNDRKDAPRRSIQAEPPRAPSFLEDEDECAESRSDREQVQEHGLDRYEQRPESGEEGEEGAAHDEDDDPAEVPRDDVFVVRVERRTAADAHLRAGQSRDRGGVPRSELPGEGDLVPRREALRGNRLEERRAAVGRFERPPHRGRQQRQEAQAVRPVEDRGEALDALESAVLAQLLEEAHGRVPALLAVEWTPGGKSSTTRSEWMRLSRPMPSRAWYALTDSDPFGSQSPSGVAVVSLLA